MAKAPCTTLINGKEYNKHELMAALAKGEFEEVLAGKKVEKPETKEAQKGIKELEAAETIPEKGQKEAATKEPTVGKTVTFEHAGSEKSGVVKGVDAKGNLEVEGMGANKGVKYTVKAKDATIDVEASKLSEAKTELDSALKELRDLTDLTKLGVKATDPQKQAEAMYKVHKALVKYAKEYLSKGINDIKKFAKDLGISVKNAKQAWDEAIGRITHTKDTVEYDLADITKTAIRRGINVRQKMAEYVKKQKDIGEAVKAFMEDAEIKGTLNARELKSLVKKAANITTDKQLDKFLDYADKVITNANFTEAVETLNSDRKAASKKRHNERTGAVKKFLGEEIFDEDGNLLLDDATFAEYSEAVKALGKQIPDHSLMEAKDASGKTLSERVSEQAAQNNPYSSMNTLTELMKAWSKLDDNIVDVDSYKAFARNVNKIRARLKELVNNGSITEHDYRKAIDNIYKLEDGKRKYEAKYATQIEQLKDAQLADAQAKMKNVDESGLNSIQKSLWEEFKRNVKVNYAKLKGLEVADLDKLNTILDRMEGGFMPEYELRGIVNKISIQGKGKEVAKQVSGISKKLKGVSDDLRRVLLLNSPARYEGELGIADGSSLWNNVTGRTQKALHNYTKAAHDLYEKWYSGLPSFYKITSKEPIIIDRYGFEGKKGEKFVTTKREYDLTKTGVVRHMVNHAAEMEAKGEKPVDFFGEQLKSKKERQAYENENLLSLLEDVYKKLKSDPSLLDADGNLDYSKVKESVERNDGKVLDKDQVQLEKLFDGIDKETGEMITSSNAIRGVNATTNPKHIKRIYIGERIGKGELQEGEMIGTRAGSSYERIDDVPKGAMQLNLEKIAQNQIRESAKDFHLNEELDRQKMLFDEARASANEEDLNTLDILQNDQRDIMKYHLTSQPNMSAINKLQGSVYAKLLITPYRLPAEALSNTSQMLIRGKSLRGLLTALPSETINPMYKKMTDVMKATNSSSLDHAEFRSMNNLEVKDGKIQREGYVKRGAEIVNGITNAMAIGGIWMPNFVREFERLSGEPFDASKHMSNGKFKDEYVDAANEASMYADREAETVVGSTIKGGGRREIALLPFDTASIKSDTPLGSIVKFLSEYPYRDTQELIRGIRQIATGVNEGRIDGAARAIGVVTNMMLYTGTYAITKAIWKKNFGNNDEKEEAEKTINELSDKDGFLDFVKQEAIANAASTAGSKYSQAGRLMTQIGITSLYNSEFLDEKQKAQLADFAESQLYFRIPKIKTGKSQYEKMQMGQVALRMIPQLNEITDIVTREIGGEEGMVAFIKQIKDTPVEKLTTDQKAKLSLIKNFVNTVNLLLLSKGTQLPFSKDFVKTLDTQIKEMGSESSSHVPTFGVRK